MRLTVILRKGGEPDASGIILSLAALRRAARHSDPKVYEIEVGGKRYRGKRLYMEGKNLVCEFEM